MGLTSSNFLTSSGCVVIAEIAQAHDGSLGNAHAYIDAVADAGADAVKFQTHIAEAESTPGEPWRVKFSPQDDTRYDYWKRMEFKEEEWKELAKHARERKLIFLSTPFSYEAIDLLQRLDVPAWKVGSGEVTNLPMIERMARTAKPVLLSSGMSSWEDLDAAVEMVRKHNAPLALFQCTTSYPCPPEKVGLNVLEQLRQRYDCPVGLSDHSGTMYPGIAAAALGADLLEVHVVFSRECFGPDTPASLTTSELRQLVRGVRFVKTALAHPVDKDTAAKELSELRRVFGKSLVASRDLPSGHRLQAEDVALKKPGTGVAASELGSFTGRRLKRAVSKNTFLKYEDVD